MYVLIDLSNKSIEFYKNTIFDFAKEYGAKVIIRRHPRQDKKELERLVDKYDDSDIGFADESLLSSA